MEAYVLVMKRVTFTEKNLLHAPGSFRAKNAPKWPFWPKMTLVSPKILIDLLNISKLLVKYVTFSAHYKLRAFDLVKVLVGEPRGVLGLIKGPRGRKSST